MSANFQKVCQVCGVAENLSLCSKCHQVAYCGKEHQKQDWKAHKKVCMPAICKNVENLDIQSSNKASSTASVEHAGRPAPQWAAKNSVKLESYLPEDVTIKDQTMAANIWKSLEQHGACVLNDFLPKDQAEEVYSDVLQMYDMDSFIDGEVLKQGSNVGPERVRWDRITWVDESYSKCKRLQLMCKKLDKLIDLCSKFSPYVIEARTKPMVACYPGNGTHYKRHVDNPAGDGRAITCLYYLNKGWNCKVDGGMLCLYPNGVRKIPCEPIFNRICIFFSDNRNPHEVLPSYKERFAVTCWYFDRDERQKALESWLLKQT